MQEHPTKLTFEDFRARLFDVCDPHINGQLRALRLWSPDYIALASPVSTCALLGPAAIHAMKRPDEAVPAGQRALCFLEGEILSFVLQRFSDYWPLGTITHGECRYKLTSYGVVLTRARNAEKRAILLRQSARSAREDGDDLGSMHDTKTSRKCHLGRPFVVEMMPSYQRCRPCMASRTAI